MSWNIDHNGDITPLDNGPRVPWWLALEEDYDDPDQVMEKHEQAKSPGHAGPAADAQTATQRGNDPHAGTA